MQFAAASLQRGNATCFGRRNFREDLFRNRIGLIASLTVRQIPLANQLARQILAGQYLFRELSITSWGIAKKFPETDSGAFLKRLATMLPSLTANSGQQGWHPAAYTYCRISHHSRTRTPTPSNRPGRGRTISYRLGIDNTQILTAKHVTRDGLARILESTIDPIGIVQASTASKIRTFLYEIAEGTTNYRSLHSLTQQVEHQYHGRFLVELIQNAHDALFPNIGTDLARIEIALVVDDGPFGALHIANDGVPFSLSNFVSLSQLGQRDKDPQKSIGSGIRAAQRSSRGNRNSPGSRSAQIIANQS